jgi:sugar fermentation stimulation protein A
MKFSSQPVSAIFQERLNRFLGIIDLEGEIVECFIPSPGRMKELLYPGSQVYVIDRGHENRKNKYDLILVENNDKLVSIDSRIPNEVVSESIEKSSIPELRGYQTERREPMVGDSRLDFLLKDHNNLLMEVKSCNLVEEGVALFPDAPTKRGTRHLQDLANSLEMGRCVCFFLIQRDDARIFKPYERRDPKFAKALREANAAGVEVYAYDSLVTLEGVFLNDKIRIQL